MIMSDLEKLCASSKNRQKHELANKKCCSRAPEQGRWGDGGLLANPVSRLLGQVVFYLPGF